MINVTRTAAAAACLAAACLLPAAGQEPTARKELVADLAGLAGVDRGFSPEAPARSRAAVEPEPGEGVAPRQSRYAPGRVLVRWQPGREPTIRELSRDGIHARAVERPDHADFAVLRIEPHQDPEAIARQLSARDDVVYAQAAYRVRTRLRPNDPRYTAQWNLPAIDMERAWDINPGGTAATVIAILDSGLAFRSGIYRYTARGFRMEGLLFPALGPIDVALAIAPDLGPSDRFVAPRDFIWEDELPFDFDGHGTHVAGTIGQATNNGVGVAGVAFNAKIMPVKVIDGEWDLIFGAPVEGTDETVARGLRYAADNGAHVINMSIGRTGAPAPAVEQAVRYAVSRGAFVVIAGGNTFDEGNEVEVLSQIAARVSGAVSVGAVGRSLERARYSTTGDYIELTAPGGNFAQGGSSAGILQQTLDEGFVFTFDGPVARYRAPRFDVFGEFFFQGTSMSAPHVSGLAALLHEQGITTPEAIEAALRKFAIDKGSPGRDDEFGYGLISARNTLRGLGLAR